MEPKEIYTIISTSADVDQGAFPEPVLEGSYSSRTSAREALLCLVAKEKETLDMSRYDVEEQGDTLWYVYLDGSAAGLFVRYEIFPSLLLD